MSQDQPLAQDQRSEDSATVDSRQKSERYWFYDGNIILQAGETMYRVHSSILARHSEIFKDMFLLPQPTETQATGDIMEGCPVVLLSDSEEDIENLLSIFYDLDKVSDFRNNLPEGMVGSMIRLGRKYVIDYLETEALARLGHDYPKTLEFWDFLYEDEVAFMLEDDVEAIINLAHEFQLFSFLPAAYSKYICEKSPEALNCDGKLSAKAKGHCLVGYANILKHIKDEALSVLRSSSSLCLPASNCTKGRCSMEQEVFSNLPLWNTDSDGCSFEIFNPWHEDSSRGLCLFCGYKVEKFVEDTRKKFWERLPTFFSLPAWHELEDSDSE